MTETRRTPRRPRTRGDAPHAQGDGAGWTCRPRTRGDAPSCSAFRPATAASAPHPRGCSRAGRGLPDLLPVGPARAGMLRRRRSMATPSGGRPPCPGMLPLRAPVATPPPRPLRARVAAHQAELDQLLNLR
ncbi:hypothetical protein B591_30928 (plasmid) [Streptomyces sp. GBA 94-10 4N24]|nr:hypothetical protein B591_30928 [Streptomyces sp. GBA 94-10 4N24]UZN63165.1 hypothetical protein B591N_30928 [Streptomyces sp. GBA 94-10 4N24]